MATRRSPSSSSMDTEEITTGVPGVSKTSRHIGQTGSGYRTGSSTASQNSAIATGTPYDTVSIATTNTGFTNVTANTSVSQQNAVGGNIPIIRPPVLQPQPQLSGTNIRAVNQPIQINAASAHQQHAAQSEISPYSGSSTTSTGASLQQQPHFNTAKAGNQTSGQYQYQQAQFANQLPGQQNFNQLLGAHAFNDAVLSIDYGAIEAYNIGIQSASDITAEQLSGGSDAAKATFKQAGNQQNIGGQSYSNYQTTTNYGNTNPEIANVLQQSGLAQGYGNYR